MWRRKIAKHRSAKRVNKTPTLPAPKRELLSNTQKRIIQGDTRADKARDVAGMGRPGGEQ